MRKLIFAVLLGTAVSCVAQDAEWLRMWEAAQRQRPKNVPTVARIAPAGEPGTPLVIHGRVVDAKGVARPNVIVFAYQTDRTGVYGEGIWRLRGWARTDAKGSFEFQTIRPASYPTGRNPAHVHFTLEGPGLPRRWTNELHFAGDPYLNARDAAAASKVTTRNGVQHVAVTLHIRDDSRF